MENLTIYQLIEYISNNWEHIHHIGDKERVQHFFLERTPAELLGFAKELEEAQTQNKRQGGDTTDIPSTSRCCGVARFFP